MIKEEYKVYQRIVGNGRNGTKMGDCMKAAMATLFKVGYDDVPHFMEYSDWHKVFREFISSQGYKWEKELWNPRALGVHCKDNMEDLLNMEGVNGLFLGTVYSPAYADIRDVPISKHVVIIDKECNIVFDPNKKYENLAEYPAARYLNYNGIVSVDIMVKNTVDR